jgi:ribosome-binding protein aMBF1 (putative translation factor)
LDLKHQEASYVEAIKDGEIIRVPEKIAILEDLFILRKIGGTPQANSVSMPLQSHSVKKEPILKNSSIMSDWKHGKFGVKKNNAVSDLIPNFNWEISKNRKMKNMTRLKLAQMINATEDQIKMMELGELPADDFVLISRIEQVFGINLRKNPGSIAQVSLADLQKRNEEKKREKSSSNIFKESTGISGNDIEILD